MTTEEKFQAAVNIIRGLPKDGPYQPSHGMMLKFYGLYKQAVEGPCREPKPAFYEVVKGYKWQAWNSLGAMTKIEAKNCYVEELKKIIETMSYTENVANFIDTLGPFYEYVDAAGKKKLNNNTTHNNKRPSSSGDLSDSGNEVMDSSSSGGSGDSSPLPNGVNGVHCEGPIDTTAPIQALQSDGKGVVEEEDSQEEGEEEEEEEEEGQEEEEEDLQVIRGVINQIPTAATNKVFSDSDSDEEYSEPAESLAHLSRGPRSPPPPLPPPPTTTTTTAQQLSTNTTACDDLNSLHSLPHSLPWPTDLQDGAVGHGGGDKSHPGGLQMTPGKTTQKPRIRTFTNKSGVVSWGTNTGGAGGAEGGGGGGGGRRGAGGVEADVNAQLMVVLQRLQTDMESVLHRLNTLETLTLTQHHAMCRQCQGSGGSNTTTTNPSGHSWWPFPELSPRSTFFLLLWPIFLHAGFRLLPLIRCRRKRS